MGKMSMQMSLMKASWQILKKDPAVLASCYLGHLLSFGYGDLHHPGAHHNWLKPLAGGSTDHQKNITYWFMFLFDSHRNYLCHSLLNAAITACAVIRMEGGPDLG